MHSAAQALVGEHDFSSFRAAECQSPTALRRVTHIAVERAGADLAVTVRANAFLHHMVRNLVGTLVYVGKGKHPPQWVAELLRARDRRKSAPTFGPQGLYLETIEYEARWGLPL